MLPAPVIEGGGARGTLDTEAPRTPKGRQMNRRLTADELFTGLFYELAQREFTSFSIRTDQIDRSIKAVFDALVDRAEETELNIRFVVSPNRFGESTTVRTALASAGLRGLISIDNPEFQHIRLQPDKLLQIIDIDRLPGGEELYSQLADVFIAAYESQDEVSATSR